MTTIVDKVLSQKQVALALLILIIVFQNILLYKGIKNDLMTIPCIARRFPVKIKSTIYKEGDFWVEVVSLFYLYEVFLVFKFITNYT